MYARACRLSTSCTKSDGTKPIADEHAEITIAQHDHDVVWFEGDVQQAFADLATNDSDFVKWSVVGSST